MSSECHPATPPAITTLTRPSGFPGITGA
ncbi:MAG: hypothetical protein JWO63_1878, partial [Frankiales bacterium]|nr:hypothetical protein [Frankiales bacterium]